MDENWPIFGIHPLYIAEYMILHIQMFCNMEMQFLRHISTVNFAVFIKKDRPVKDGIKARKGERQIIRACR